MRKNGEERKTRRSLTFRLAWRLHLNPTDESSDWDLRAHESGNLPAKTAKEREKTTRNFHRLEKLGFDVPIKRLRLRGNIKGQRKRNSEDNGSFHPGRGVTAEFNNTTYLYCRDRFPGFVSEGDSFAGLLSDKGDEDFSRAINSRGLSRRRGSFGVCVGECRRRICSKRDSTGFR